MAEIKRKPVSIQIDGKEYDAFDDDHSWGDIARWVLSHAEGADELIEAINQERR